MQVLMSSNSPANAFRGKSVSQKSGLERATTSAFPSTNTSSITLGSVRLPLTIIGTLTASMMGLTTGSILAFLFLGLRGEKYPSPMGKVKYVSMVTEI